MYMHICKPFLGSLIAGTALIILLPLLLIVSGLLVLSTGKSPFFLQTRVGYRGRLFKIIKFKTMTDEKDEHGNLLPDEQRVFRLGSFLRSSSLDELPQLINILKGDMAFVGPRPWIPSQMAAFPPSYCQRRCSVRPGITGMAQIHGRNGIPFYRRLCYDLIYVHNINLKLDISLIFQTARTVLIREGIQQCNEAFHNKLGQTLVHNDLSMPSSTPSPNRSF
ncbi:sugar transferase [Akkermansia muciniphila]|uniref:sugar transferase n=1 Tax=Akkermansia muciniphila TaxID=239935 RepID=UPI0031B8AF8F|nr:sugar transferase [Akkermansia muciniphila]